MERVEKNYKVTLIYVLKDEKGQLIEKAGLDHPLTYLHGYSHIIPGLEKNLEGKVEGAHFQCVIEPDQAYGSWDEELVMSIPRADLKHLGELTVGMEIEMYEDRPEDDEDSELDDGDVIENLIRETQGFEPWRTVSGDDRYIDKGYEDDADDESDEDDEDGEASIFVVKEILENEVVLDGNHFLAGKTLYFEGEILHIEMASFEEIEEAQYNSMEEDDQDDRDLLR